jgi:hypothetical protein
MSNEVTAIPCPVAAHQATFRSSGELIGLYKFRHQTTSKPLARVPQDAPVSDPRVATALLSVVVKLDGQPGADPGLRHRHALHAAQSAFPKADIKDAWQD